MPMQLHRHLNISAKVGVLSLGVCLDLQNREVLPEDCEVLVWNISSLELPGSAKYIRHLRKHKLHTLFVLFENAFYQCPEANYNTNSALSPHDVRREIMQGGFAIDFMESWENADHVDYNPNYLGHKVNSAGFLPEEILWGESQKILVKAQACQSAYHLEKKVSIIILALNQLEYTKKCIESLAKHCRQKYELILVNNGSTDGTKEYFDAISGAKVIHNAENLGVAKGWNQGLELVTGDYALILNNDTICGPNFLENMVRCAQNHPSAGIVSCRSNSVGGPQIVNGFSYQSEAEITQLAKEIQDANDLSAWEISRAKGFCMLIPQNVLKDVGPFDEVFGLGNFEDDDYSCRARYLGYKLLVADDSFLFHFGSVSFKGAQIDWTTQMLKNDLIFKQKWSKGRENGLANHSVGYYSLQQGKIAEQNQEFTQAFTHYRLALEDRLTAEKSATLIKEFLAQHYSVESSLELLRVLREKFPEVKNLQFVADLNIWDKWQNEVKSLLEKGEFEKALLLLKSLVPSGQDLFMIYNYLGLVRYYQSFFAEASTWFKKALAIKPGDEDVLLNFHDTCIRLGDTKAVEAILEKALLYNPSSPVLKMISHELQRLKSENPLSAENLAQLRSYNAEIENLLREGLWEQALELLDEVLPLEPEYYRSLNNYGIAEWYRQDYLAAYNYFKKAVVENPWFLDAFSNFYHSGKKAKQPQDFDEVLTLVKNVNGENPEFQSIYKQIKQDEVEKMLYAYKDSEQKQYNIPKLLQKAHDFIDKQDVDQGILVFGDVLDIDPTNLDALNGMGIGAFYRGDFTTAYEVFKQAVELYPLDNDSLKNLWEAAKKTNITAEALLYLRNAVEVDPNLKDITSILEGFE